jgi:hypothetical protein
MFKLLELIAFMRSVFGDLPIGTLFSIIQRLASIGLPPPIEQEDNLRHWCRSLIPILNEVAGLTSTEIDDLILQVLLVSVEDDDSWAALHALLMLAKDGRVRGDVGAEALSDKTGLDVATILIVVQAIIKLIQMLR